MFVVRHLLLQASTGFRAASRVIQAIANFFGIPWAVPDHTTGPAWLLRISLYQLQRPKQKASDWIWIVDHTVQVGPHKCLVVLPPFDGLSPALLRLAASGRVSAFGTPATVDLLPVKHLDQHVVLSQLEDTIQVTGAPCAILGDHGSDLHAGVNRFCQKHPETRNLYDIAHKAATLMKARLDKNLLWKSFLHQAGQTTFRKQQTELSFLMPPSQRSKAKYMNMGDLIRWGRETLCLVIEPTEAVLRHVSSERLEEKLGWLRAFGPALGQWSEYQALVDASVDEVRRRGYSESVAYQTALRLSP